MERTEQLSKMWPSFIDNKNETQGCKIIFSRLYSGSDDFKDTLLLLLLLLSVLLLLLSVLNYLVTANTNWWFLLEYENLNIY